MDYIECGNSWGVNTIIGHTVYCVFVSKRASRALLAGHFGKGRNTIKTVTLVWGLGLSSLFYFLRDGFVPVCESESFLLDEQEKTKIIFFIKLPPLPKFAFSEFVCGTEDLLNILPYLDRKM